LRRNRLGRHDAGRTPKPPGHDGPLGAKAPLDAKNQPRNRSPFAQPPQTSKRVGGGHWNGFAVRRALFYSPPTMDYRIHRPDCRCGSTGKPLAPGERFYSSLVRREGKIERLDIATDAWAGPPIGSLAWWRSTMPAAEATATLAPAEVLLDVLEQLADSAADEERSLRYLLALVLVRRRVLRIIDEDLTPSGDSPALLGLHCRRRSCDYRVAIAPPPAATAAAVQQRLLDLLWSGEQEAA